MWAPSSLGIAACILWHLGIAVRNCPSMPGSGGQASVPINTPLILFRRPQASRPSASAAASESPHNTTRGATSGSPNLHGFLSHSVGGSLPRQDRKLPVSLAAISIVITRLSKRPGKPFSINVARPSENSTTLEAITSAGRYESREISVEGFRKGRSIQRHDAKPARMETIPMAIEAETVRLVP